MEFAIPNDLQILCKQIPLCNDDILTRYTKSLVYRTPPADDATYVLQISLLITTIVLTLFFMFALKIINHYFKQRRITYLKSLDML